MELAKEEEQKFIRGFNDAYTIEKFGINPDYKRLDKEELLKEAKGPYLQGFRHGMAEVRKEQHEDNAQDLTQAPETRFKRQEEKNGSKEQQFPKNPEPPNDNTPVNNARNEALKDEMEDARSIAQSYQSLADEYDQKNNPKPAREPDSPRVGQGLPLSEDQKKRLAESEASERAIQIKIDARKAMMEEMRDIRQNQKRGGRGRGQ